MRERRELGKVGLALLAQDTFQLAAPEARGRGELEKEVVAVAAGAYEGRLEPFVELVAAGAGDSIDDLVGAPLLLHLAFRYQAVSNKPFEHLVEVADVEVSPLRSNELLELRPQFVAVRLALVEERQNRMVDGQNRLLVH